MPEPNKRLSVHGIPRAEKEFDRYVRRRVQAERSTVDMERETKDLERAARELEREAARGS